MEQRITQLFIRYIQNNCGPEEVSSVLELIAKGGYEQEWMEAMEAVQNDSANLSGALEPDEARLFGKIKQQILLNRPNKNKWKWIAYAASIVLLLALSLLFFGPLPEKEIPAEKVVYTAAVKAKLDRKWIKLPDGTSVQLNSNSELEYPENFAGKKNREVRLVGEAYFDVKHNASQPFIIHTGKVNTTVLGTAFNIRAYKTDESVTVTVTRGKVVVEEGNKTLAVLTPNTQVTWTATSAEPIVLHTVDTKNVVAWKAQDLILDDVSLADAATAIGVRYGIKVHFKNEKVKSCRFTAAFLNRNDISQVLTVIGDITGASLVLKDGTLVIDGQGC